MTNPFEKFDQIEARFTKLFAACVLLLVVTLIAIDILTVAFDPKATEPTPPESAIRSAPISKCKFMPDGTKICDLPPPDDSTPI